MEYLELTVSTCPQGIDTVVNLLTAAGFEDLVIEDQQEFETFLEENRAYWDYIDEDLEQKLQGLSQIKLYIEKEDRAALSRIESLLEDLRNKQGDKLGSLTLKSEALPESDWSESW